MNQLRRNRVRENSYLPIENTAALITASATTTVNKSRISFENGFRFE